MQSGRKRIAGAVSGVGMVALVASSLSMIAPAASAGAVTVPGVTAKSITVGGLVQETSASGYSETNSVIGAEAYFKTVNAHGGVYGRKINYIGGLTDDGTPTKDLTQAHALVQEKHVFAVVPIATTSLAGGGTYLIKQKVPFFGWGVEPAFCNNTVGFGFSGCLIPTTKADKVATTPSGLMTDLLKKQGKYKKNLSVSMISEDNTAGTFGITVSKAAFVAGGYKVPYSKAPIPSGGTSDYSPYVNTLMTSATGKPPTIMYYVTELPNTDGISEGMNAAGFKGYSLDAVSYTPSVVDNAATDSAAQGRYTWIQFAAPESGTPATKAEVKTLQKVAGKITGVLSEQYTIGYLSAALFVAMLKKTGKNLTTASFLKAANSNFSYGIKGLMGTTSWPTDHKEATGCGSLLQIEGKQYIQKVPLTCYPTTPLSTATQ